MSPSPQLCRCPPEATPCANSWEEATLWVEWALTPRGHDSPWNWYAKATASTIQWANLCLETAFPFCWPLWQTKSCSELLKLWVRSTNMCNALIATLRLNVPPPRVVLAGSPSDRGKAWWEPRARIQAGVSRQHESSPARTQGTLRLPKTPGGPRPAWWK